MTPSVVGLGLAVLYLPCAAWIVQDELRHGHGGWINLRGFGTSIVTAPSQVTLGMALGWLGVAPPSYAAPGWRDVAQLTAHVVVTAAMLYGLGAGLEWLVRTVLRG